MRDGAAQVGQIYLRHHAGHRIPVEIHVIPLRGEDGTITGAAEIFAEHVSVPEFTSQDLVFSACGCLDEETGVPNHALTESYLREQLGLLENHHIPFAVFVVRADSLHDFQALHGREAGVAILSAVSRTLRHSSLTRDGIHSGTAALTMKTTSAAAEVTKPWWRPSGHGVGADGLVRIAVVGAAGKRRRSRVLAGMAFGSPCSFALTTVACGGSGGCKGAGRTPPGTYSPTITAP
jgi:hypothetical protein